jgi:hypothetical protein
VTESGWSRDLLESDRRYFEAGADVLTIPGAVIAALRGAETLAAGCVVQRIDAEAAGLEPDRWLAEVEDRVRALGSPRARLYLEAPQARLEEALARRGYRSRAEHGFTRVAGDGGGAEIELVPAEDEDSWSARRELMRRQEQGIDGHPVDADLWITLERRKCEAGYMRPYLMRRSGRVVGAVCAAPCGRLMRFKNLVVDIDYRRRGVATATAVSFARMARDEGLEAAGCFVLEGEPGMVVYPRAGYGPSAVQTEWMRELS